MYTLTILIVSLSNKQSWSYLYEWIGIQEKFRKSFWFFWKICLTRMWIGCVKYKILCIIFIFLAMNNLANVYKLGNGCKKNNEKANEFYEKVFQIIKKKADLNWVAGNLFIFIYQEI